MSKVNGMRNQVREMLSTFKSAVMELHVVTYPGTGLMHDFLIKEIRPRVGSVLDQVQEMVSKYTSDLHSISGAHGDVRGIARLEEALRTKSARALRPDVATAVSMKTKDSTFAMMYILKFVRGAAAVAALHGAQSVFAEIALREMTDEPGELKRPPPSLARMLLMFLALDGTIQLAVLLIIALLSFSLKTPDNAFLIDDEFISTFLAEYFVTTTLIAVLGVLFARIMWRKRYFNYEQQVRGVSLVYRDMMIGVALTVNALPFFLMF